MLQKFRFIWILPFALLLVIGGCSSTGDKIVDPIKNAFLADQADTTNQAPDYGKGPMPMAAAASTDPLRWPTSLWEFYFPGAYGQTWKIVCGYGCYKHQYTNYPRAGYYSIDLIRANGTTLGSCVTACARGVVVYSGWMDGYGWCVVIDHDYGHTGRGYKSIVAHLLTDPRQFVNVGNDLKAGTILGYCGSSGTDSPHIHFGVWQNNMTVPLNGISGYSNLVVGGVYNSYCWPCQPPHGSCNCPW